MFRVVAYIAKSYEGATTLALRGDGEDIIHTCPPFGDNDIKKQHDLLEGYDLIVFNLHGLPHVPVWIGDLSVPALKSSTLRKLNFIGSGVFAINCYLGDEHQPMFKALKKTGAAWVVAGEGLNYGGLDRPVGADILLRWFVHFLRKGNFPEKALRKAKVKASLLAPKWNQIQRLALIDALKFKLWRF